MRRKWSEFERKPRSKSRSSANLGTPIGRAPAAVRSFGDLMESDRLEACPTFVSHFDTGFDVSC